MHFSELESLAMQLYENGVDIPVSALSFDESGARYVHIEANPKSVLFWVTESTPDPKTLTASKVINDSSWSAVYCPNHKLYEGDWELCNSDEFKNELRGSINRCIGQLNNLLVILQKVL